MSNFIPISRPSITELEVAHVTDAVRSGWVSSLGPYIEEFETRFAKLCGTRFALAVSSGTTGLHLALMSAGLKAGDEVIVPDLTFIATANAVSYIGAKPVFADIDGKSLGLCAASVERLISSKTKAIIPVHLYGHPADMDPLLALAKRYGLRIIEDAAEAHGARYKGRQAGSIGTCGVFSFYGNKIITSGEGGMITTNDEELWSKAKRLRDHAMSPTRRYWHEEIGYNYRMTNLQAALGVAQMKRVDELTARRSEIIGWYRENLGGQAGLTLNRVEPWADCAFWMQCVEVEGLIDGTRNQLMAALKQRGVDSRPYFYPLSEMPMYAHPATSTPVAHRISQTGLNLPLYVDLTRDEVDLVCTAFIDALSTLEHSFAANAQ